MKLLPQVSLLLGSPLAVNALAYDYIVIGGGTGGLTVANRLSQNSDKQVLVLEAGPNAENLQEVFVPGLIGAGQAFTTLNWAYPTVPQTNLNNRTLTINAGKALGGSTVINSMIFPRAEKEQYDAWGTLNNNDSSWTWNALLPYFRKSEIFTPPNEFQQANGATFDRNVHGFDEERGRVKSGFPNFFYQQWTLWRQTAMGLGFPASPDLGNGSPHAVGVAPASIDPANNTRCSAACAYYTDFADRPNFTVLTNATVIRILWAVQERESDITASGVEYIDANNETRVVNVSRGGEVIVSAGTIGTPKVLELSGVGNSSILQAAGVKPVLDLPSVGENFADHVHSWANAFTNLNITNDLLSLDPAFAEQQLNLWFENRTGLYSSASRSLGIAAPSNIFNQSEFKHILKESEEKLDYFATLLSNGNPLLARGIQAQHRLALDLYRSNKNLPLEMNLSPGYSGPTSFADRPARTYNTVHSVLYAPLSRGKTHISSSDPLMPPTIDPAYWTHPLDVAAQVGGIKLARKMLTTGPMSSVYEGEFEPGLDKVTDQDIENWLRSVVKSDTHEIGTMAMLPQELGGVVDTKLRIYGLKNVRVVDASIIPFPISAHLVSTFFHNSFRQT
ncbi:alcohol oxidase [Dendrothele bispora CBS 962.96]|uniref:Alcohol oxidase n=1 Tax=Dendrothele bispora (strain CBS 962.96) TaxID=1314807 RepID=A0A4S8LEN6_DENBC|nr:alcohol oxidase [Dendrothele bispora CBS 962.96]